MNIHNSGWIRNILCSFIYMCNTFGNIHKLIMNTRISSITGVNVEQILVYSTVLGKLNCIKSAPFG